MKAMAFDRKHFARAADGLAVALAVSLPWSTSATGILAVLWLLAALAALPVIWWLLRVTPPAPRRIDFPAIRLLLGLTPHEETPAHTPWWLIVLRTVLAALVIIGLAHPLLNPTMRLAGSGAVALVIDDGWSAARDWPQRQTAALDILAEADREGRAVLLVTTAPLASDEPPPPLQGVRASDARAAVQAERQGQGRKCRASGPALDRGGAAPS